MANKNGKIPVTSQLFNWRMYVHVDFISKKLYEEN